MSDDLQQAIMALSANRVANHFPDGSEAFERLQVALEEASTKLVKNKGPLKTRLDAFKSELGEDHYILISDTNNFMPMFEKWETEVAQRNTDILKQAVKSALPPDHSCEDDDILYFIAAMLEL